MVAFRLSPAGMAREREEISKAKLPRGKHLPNLPKATLLIEEFKKYQKSSNRHPLGGAPSKRALESKNACGFHLRSQSTWCVPVVLASATPRSSS